jgi:mannose-6-phosphate isomerase-like protein (cupin superfamily)
MYKSLTTIPTEINIRGVLAKTIVNHRHATIKNLILHPDEAIPTHQVGVDVTFFILEGTGTITVGHTVHLVGPNDIVLCPPDTPMSVQAAGDGLSFLNIKTPGI